MISGLWEKIELYCQNGHDKPVKMELTQVGQVLYYMCPKYLDTNRESHEAQCKNRISTKDFETMLKHISDILYTAEMSNEVVHLRNAHWTRKGIKYHIFEHSDRIKVIVYNKNEVEK